MKKRGYCAVKEVTMCVQTGQMSHDLLLNKLRMQIQLGYVKALFDKIIVGSVYNITGSDINLFI